MVDVNQTLLQTKLHRPPITRRTDLRAHLIELVEQLNHDIHRPLTLVTAPAGFGKTTLVSTWLEHRAASQPAVAASLPNAWLSLDENDSDLNFFLRYFIAALRTIFNNACEDSLSLLQAQQLPPRQSCSPHSVMSSLKLAAGECVLVLDDYHTIRGVDVHNLLIELARHWPKPLHLVLVSRIHPPLPLIRMRASGMLRAKFAPKTCALQPRKQRPT